MEVLNFKKIEVSGHTKEEALAKAPFKIAGDATRSYRAWKAYYKGPVGAMEFREFLLNYLKKNSKYGLGIGFYIELKPAVLNSSKKPYRMSYIKTSGIRKYKCIYQLIEKETNKILVDGIEQKAQAKLIAKELYSKKGYTGELYCKLVKQVVEGEPIIFEMSYKPSKKTCMGTYLVFGIGKD